MKVFSQSSKRESISNGRCEEGTRIGGRFERREETVLLETRTVILPADKPGSLGCDDTPHLGCGIVKSKVKSLSHV